MLWLGRGGLLCSSGVAAGREIVKQEIGLVWFHHEDRTRTGSKREVLSCRVGEVNKREAENEESSLISIQSPRPLQSQCSPIAS